MGIVLTDEREEEIRHIPKSAYSMMMKPKVYLQAIVDLIRELDAQRGKGQ